MPKMVLTEAEATVLDGAVGESRRRFSEWAALKAPQLPANPVDACQVSLIRWQDRNFGIVSDPEVALGVIEEYGEALRAETEDKAQAELGDVLVYSGNIAMSNQLALGPIMDLSDVIARSWFADLQDDGPPPPQATTLSGELARCVLKHVQKVRGMEDHDVYTRELVWRLARLFAFVQLDIFQTSDVPIGMLPEVYQRAHDKVTPLDYRDRERTDAERVIKAEQRG